MPPDVPALWPEPLVLQALSANTVAMPRAMPRAGTVRRRIGRGRIAELIVSPDLCDGTDLSGRTVKRLSGRRG